MFLRNTSDILVIFWYFFLYFDLVITRSDGCIFTDVQVLDIINSDHFSVLCEYNTRKPSPLKKQIVYRKIKNIIISDFKDDINNIDWNPQEQDLEKLIFQYDSYLGQILDKHAPLKQSIITVRPESPWMTDQIKMERRKRRQLEQTWRKTRLTVHREMYKHQRTIVTNLISEAKKNCYQKRILDNSGDQKVIFKIIKIS